MNHDNEEQREYRETNDSHFEPRYLLAISQLGYPRSRFRMRGAVSDKKCASKSE